MNILFVEFMMNLQRALHLIFQSCVNDDQRIYSAITHGFYDGQPYIHMCTGLRNVAKRISRKREGFVPTADFNSKEAECYGWMVGK